MTPSMKIEKIFEIYQLDRVYISSTIIADVNLAQAEFNKICYNVAAHNACIYVCGRGFDVIDFSNPTVEKRLCTFEDVFLS